MGSSSARRMSARDHLVLTGLGLGLDGHADDRLGELHALEDDGVALGAERVAGGGLLEAHGGGDVAGVDLVHLLAVVGVHAQNAADALALALGGVVDVAAGLQRAGIDAEEHQLAHEGIGHDLERQSAEGLFIVRLAGDDLVGVLLRAFHRRDVQRRGQEIDDGVQKRLHALVAVAGAAQDGGHGAGDGGLADAGHQFLVGKLLAVQVFLHQFVVGLGHGFDQRGAGFLGGVLEVGGDLGFVDGVAQIVGVDLGLHLEKIHLALEIGLGADGQLNGHGVGLQALFHHGDHAVKVRADDVHLVDIGQPRHVILRRLPPDGLGLGLHAALGAEHRHGAVQHAQRALDLHGEINVAGRVYDVDLMSAPFAGGGGGSDGDAALLLLLHPVHGRHALVHLAEAVRPARVEEDALGGGGLAGVDVRHDAYVANVIQGMRSSHENFSLSFRIVAGLTRP